MKPEITHLYALLNALQGDWRNAIYIQCSSCPYARQVCGSYLLAADADAAPILFPILLFQELTGEVVDKVECVGTLNRQAFESLYHKWLFWHTENKQQCSILQTLQNNRR